MPKVKLDFHRWKGIREIRSNAAADRFILEAAEQVARRAGPGYKAHQSPGRNRARAVVVPDTPEAAVETAQDPHILISAMDAARNV